MTWTTRPRSEFGDLAAIRAGAGPTVLLLHGVGLRAEAWNAQIDALSARFSVIAPDMPGHGDSRGFAEAPRLSDFTARVARAVEAADCGSVRVAGHSMGALIALELAVRRPEQVRAVAALNAIHRRTAAAAAAVRARAEALDGVSAPEPAETLRRWFGTACTPESAACRDWLTSVDPAGYRAAYRVFAAADGPADDALRALDAPALFLTGAEEPNATPAMSRAMAELAPFGVAREISGAAHMAPMTHSPEVDAALIAFFSEHAA